MNEEIIPILPFNKPNRITTQSHALESFVHIIKIYEGLERPTDWTEELDIINQAGQDDTIVLDLCTPGGCLSTALLFNRALTSTLAHTVAIIGPECSSAGSVIALSCQEHILDRTSELMCHTSQFGIVGKEVDIFEHVTFSRRRLEKLFNIVYSGFCTQAEINSMIDGKPMYFDGDDLANRLENLYEYRDMMQEIEAEERGETEGEAETFNLLDEIDKRVADGVEKALGKVLSKYDLTPKVKPARAKPAKKEVVDSPVKDN